MAGDVRLLAPCDAGAVAISNTGETKLGNGNAGGNRCQHDRVTEAGAQVVRKLRPDHQPNGATRLYADPPRSAWLSDLNPTVTCSRRPTADPHDSVNNRVGVGVISVLRILARLDTLPKAEGDRQDCGFRPGTARDCKTERAPRGSPM